MNDFEREAVRVAMTRMFRSDGWLDICAIDECLKLARVAPPSREYQALRVLHCVHWRDMAPEMRRAVAERVAAMFAEPPFDVAAMFDPPPVEAVVSANEPMRRRWFALLRRGAA